MEEDLALSIPFSRPSNISRVCIERLKLHQPEQVDLTTYPSSKLAAVLVLLYEKAGELRVLLTTRSKALRSHPGQTALPGGKVDETDHDIIGTAYREANEEVRLPLASPHIHTICTLRPFMSPYRLLVTPVVAILDDLAVLEGLQASAGEVEHIFDHPLEALLNPTIARKEPLVSIGSEHWPYETELHNTTDSRIATLGNTTYRMHRFRSAASAIKGLTADILILAAEIAFEKKPTFERWGPGQLVGLTSILLFLKENGEDVEGTQRTFSVVTGALAVAST
ncbi:hypothetical protein EW146_g4007 [Bondarzewia mesenterica]|uniref:Nudix hydrolase domain-containing protein n=1 Tax=Bondarzewia mesenterica TaxID=1095465 RepID=A0A4S4LWC4_9AGAM|nr:hypothetical protein EW146_g4007 [Bondarzewia mesenterica]